MYIDVETFYWKYKKEQKIISYQLTLDHTSIGPENPLFLVLQKQFEFNQ